MSKFRLLWILFLNSNMLLTIFTSNIRSYQQAILNISDLCGKFNTKKERYPQKNIFFHQDIHN